MPRDRPLPQGLFPLVAAPSDEVRPLLEALAADPRPDDPERLIARLAARPDRLRGGTRSEPQREEPALAARRDAAGHDAAGKRSGPQCPGRVAWRDMTPVE